MAGREAAGWQCAGGGWWQSAQQSIATSAHTPSLTVQKTHGARTVMTVELLCCIQLTKCKMVLQHGRFAEVHLPPVKTSVHRIAYCDLQSRLADKPSHGRLRTMPDQLPTQHAPPSIQVAHLLLFIIIIIIIIV
jgi:hypothetical protein